MASDLSSAVLIPLLISGCGISLTAIVILIYHFLVVRFCLGRPNRLRVGTIFGFNSGHENQSKKLGIDKSSLALIPTVKYSRSSQCECAICLSEFEEGVSVRILPNCRHSFHVKCVDRWLASHVNCPVCRNRVFPFAFSEWIVEFKDEEDAGERGRGRHQSGCRSKHPPVSGSGFRRSIPIQQPNNNNNTNVTGETSHSEINEAENNNNNNSNKDSYNYSSLKDVIGSTQVDRKQSMFAGPVSLFPMVGWRSTPPSASADRDLENPR